MIRLGTTELAGHKNNQASARAEGTGLPSHRLDDPLILFRHHTLFRLHIVGLRVGLVHMIGFEDMARVHMAPVHSVRVALTHMLVAGMVATVPVRR
jgi:hypothetical protein